MPMRAGGAAKAAAKAGASMPSRGASTPSRTRGAPVSKDKKVVTARKATAKATSGASCTRRAPKAVTAATTGTPSSKVVAYIYDEFQSVMMLMEMM